MFWKRKNKNKEAEEAPAEEIAEPVNINVVVKTDLGNVRTNNEDTASFFRMADNNLLREKGYLLIVADGMGGHQAGEVASRMAVEIISEEYFRPSPGVGKEKLLNKAFNIANTKIFDLASANDIYRGMGTTCTVLVIYGNAIYYGHVGDSRAYLCKNKKISQITQDHTYVQELVSNGDITAEQAHTHPQRNVLTNAMGTKPTLRVDTGKYQLSFTENDRLLLCSDGLYDYLSEEEIGVAMSAGSLQEVADHFINEAKRRGGKDNISVVLAELAAFKDDSNVRSTREVDMLKMTRDADIPANLNSTDHDR